MFIRAAAAATATKSLQSCPTLCDPIDSSPPGSSVSGILQARILKWVAISFSNAWKWKAKVKSLSRVRLLATPWTAAHQAPPSMGFSRQEYWSGVPLPSLGLGLYRASIFSYDSKFSKQLFSESKNYSEIKSLKVFIIPNSTDSQCLKGQVTCWVAHSEKPEPQTLVLTFLVPPMPVFGSVPPFPQQSLELGGNILTLELIDHCDWCSLLEQ